jgi:hypothetical protein
MREQLLERAQSLAMRLSHLGVSQDLAALSLADLWGVLRFLQRASGGD